MPFGTFAMLGCRPRVGLLPAIASISHDVMNATGGDSVTLTGTNLSGASVTIGGSSGYVSANTATSVTFTTPSKTVGIHDVQVTTSAGQSNTLPIVAEFNPLVWLPADAAAISGSNVTAVPNRAAGSTVLNLGVAQATSGSQPTYQSSRASFGGRPAIVHSGGTRYLDSAVLGTTRAQPFTFYVVAEWTTPSSLSHLFDGVDATSRVIVTSYSNQALISSGSDLNGGTITAATATLICGVFNGASSAIYIGDMATAVKTGTAAANALRSLRIGATNSGTNPFSGAWGTIGAFAGAHDATTRARIGDMLRSKYGIASAPATSVTSISPTSGSDRGGTSVTITGTGFTSATGANVGGLALTSFTVVNDTTITGVTAKHVAGLVDVAVTKSATDYTKTNAYTFNVVGLYSSGAKFRGVNRAGPEYGSEWDGWNGQTYFEIPSGSYLTSEITYYKNKGFNVVRIPFAWERMQHTLSSALDSTYSTNYQTMVNAFTNAGFRVIVDCHNYVRYATGAWSGSTQVNTYTQRVLGDGSLTMAHIQDLWTRVAGLFTSNDYVIFGLMNEAHDFTLNNNTYFSGLNSIIAAIRGAGATSQLILVPNSDGSNVEHWSTWTGTTGGGSLDSVNALTITDTANNYAFDFHCYIDAPAGSSDFSTKLNEVTTWLRTNNKKGFLSEGFTEKIAANGSAAFGGLMTYLNSNNDVWLGLAPWNLDPYTYATQDGNGTYNTDGPEMAWYSPYLTASLLP